MTAEQKPLIYYVMLLTLVLLSMPMLQMHFGIQIRFGQLALLGLFVLLSLEAISRNEYNYVLVGYLFVWAVLMILISINSPYPKVKQSTFFLKYLLIYPSILYVGYRVVFKLTMQQLINLLEKTALIIGLFEIFLAFFPIPFLIHDRGGFTSQFQGTFFEAGWLAKAMFLMVVPALLMRIQYQIWPEKKRYIFGMYLFYAMCIVLTRNKTVWLALIGSIAFLTLYKITIYTWIHKKNREFNTVSKAIHETLKIVNVKYLLLGVLLLITAFWFYNESLDKPIISAAILQEKMQSERGKAYSVAIRLLQDSSWLGAYGFGFIESFFTTYTDKIVGLGEGTGVIFNSYLDIWVSVGIAGLFYHLFFIYLMFSMRSLVTIVLPISIFIMANLNPLVTSEWYYLLIGLVIGFKARYVTKSRF